MLKGLIKFLVVLLAAYGLVFIQEWLVLLAPAPFKAILLIVIFPVWLQIYLTDKLSVFGLILGTGIFAELISSSLPGSILIALLAEYFLVAVLISRVITNRSTPAVIFLLSVAILCFHLARTVYVVVASLFFPSSDLVIINQAWFIITSASVSLGAGIIIYFVIAIFIRRVNPAYILDVKQ
ncbi:MAG: hypothetical protein Q7K39_02820 [Candidatus Magasanikbacteria bacterium]|nr:hypothetical protein [Candidatus Magasanikbacteria bacterium]